MEMEMTCTDHICFGTCDIRGCMSRDWIVLWMWVACSGLTHHSGQNTPSSSLVHGVFKRVTSIGGRLRNI